MLYVRHIVATNKIFIEYLKKEITKQWIKPKESDSGRKKGQKKKKQTIKHAEKKQQNIKSKSFSISNLSINGLNSSVKRHRLAE